MKNFIRLFGITLMVIIGIAFSACDHGGTNETSGTSSASSVSLIGTWYSYGNVYKYTFSSSAYEQYYNGNPYRKGNYTTTKDSMTMTVTHIGNYLSSSYTWLSPSTWYSKDQFVSAYINYYREQYRASIQSTYDTYVKNYGVATANQAFQNAYGTTNIDAIVEEQYGSTLTQLENSINTSANNSLYNSSTVAFAFSGATLMLGGVSLTKD